MIIDLIKDITEVLLSTIWDVVPIILVLGGFQLGVLRQRIPNLQRVLVGSIYVVVGLACFLFGLERALFPLGEAMATQLTDVGAGGDWSAYWLAYAFAFAIGFAATVAEPSLIAVSLKAREVSGGSVGAWGLRCAVALGVAIALVLGTLRIVTGTPLYLFIIAGYVVVIVHTVLAPREIIPLAYDIGGVTTSTITVPLVIGLGLGLASGVPGRSVLVDGFGMIALACLLPIITVMAYAQATAWLAQRSARRALISPQ